jgi:hypothetical protein
VRPLAQSKLGLDRRVLAALGRELQAWTPGAVERLQAWTRSSPPRPTAGAAMALGLLAGRRHDRRAVEQLVSVSSMAAVSSVAERGRLARSLPARCSLLIQRGPAGAPSVGVGAS